MPKTAILIGSEQTCSRLERQLDLLPDRPVTLGWVVARPGGEPDSPGVLGTLHDLESIVRSSRPDLALVSLPAPAAGLITTIRTRLRRLGVQDRFMPTLEDQLDGVGPRSRMEIEPGALLDRPARPIDEAPIRQAMAGRRILITGAGGTIGTELARLACRFDPEHLVLVERSENALFEIDRQIARRSPGLPRTALLHDVVDAAATLRHFRRLRPQVVFHAAAHKHVPMMEDHPAAAVDNNVFGTRSVADAAAAAGAERFVFVSTDKAVRPTSVMGATKRLAELYVSDLSRRSDTAFAIVRFGNVLGSTGSVLDVWTSELAEGGPLSVTDPRMTRYFMTISEAAALVMQSAALVDPAGRRATVFVLDMGEPVRIIDLAQRFIAHHGLEGAVGIVVTGARPGEKLHEELACESEPLQPTDHPAIRAWSPAGGAADPRLIDEMLRELAPELGRNAAAIAETLHRLAAA